MVLVFSTDVSIKDHPDMKTQIVVTFGATEIKDWDGTEKEKNGKLVNKLSLNSVRDAECPLLTKLSQQHMLNELTRVRLQSLFIDS